jgi:Sulfotransferase family
VPTSAYLASLVLLLLERTIICPTRHASLKRHDSTLTRRSQPPGALRRAPRCRPRTIHQRQPTSNPTSEWDSTKAWSLMQLERQLRSPSLLLCSERSGSNLLRSLLDAHPDVFAPNTMALGLLCADYDSRQGNYPQTWNSLLLEVTRRINASTFYTGVEVDAQEITQDVAENDTAGLYLYAYYQGMRDRGANRLVIKEHQAWRLAPFFLKNFPRSKIVVQVRDPRDHAVSCRRLAKLYAAYHGSLPRAARMWATDQYEALQLEERYGSRTVRIHRYEDLVLDPVKTLQGICEFLELEWKESMLDFHILQAEQMQQSERYLRNMWANLDCPVTSGSVGQWKEHLRPYELRAIIREVGPLLSMFGYEADCRDETKRSKSLSVYRLLAASRYSLVTTGIWLAWLVVTRDYHVPLDVVLGNAVRAHLPYERFRDRLGYRL